MLRRYESLRASWYDYRRRSREGELFMRNGLAAWLDAWIEHVRPVSMPSKVEDRRWTGSQGSGPSLSADLHGEVTDVLVAMALGVLEGRCDA
jgi:hypothetical protein